MGAARAYQMGLGRLRVATRDLTSNLDLELLDELRELKLKHWQ